MIRAEGMPEADPELSLTPKARAELVDRVQRDWKEREFVETIQLNIMQIVTFLNTFDQSARFKLGGSTAPAAPASARPRLALAFALVCARVRPSFARGCEWM